jgi:hypothetical protein
MLWKWSSWSTISRTLSETRLVSTILQSSPQKESHHCSHQCSHVLCTWWCNEQLCSGKGTRVNNTSAVWNPTPDPLQQTDICFNDPSEVNKTLTAEELFEYLKRSLYTVSPVFSVHLIILTFQISAEKLGQNAKCLKSNCLLSFTSLIIEEPLFFLMKPMCLCSHALSTINTMLLSQYSCINWSTIKKSWFWWQIASGISTMWFRAESQ